VQNVCRESLGTPPAPARYREEITMTHKLLIDGHLVSGALELDVINPATGKVFEKAPRADKAQAEQAIAAAKRAYPAWAKLTFAERGRFLERWADAVAARRDDFVRLMTEENGKPLAESQVEVSITINTLRYFAKQEMRPRTIRQSKDQVIIQQRYPQGVLAAITPWNFPMVLLMFKVAPALIVGNTVIAKPAPTTPLSSVLLGEVASDILPPGVFQTLVDLNDIGPLLTQHPDVAHVSFTGSTPTGRKVAASASETIKRVSLELGGNDAAIVLDDAIVEDVMPKIFAAATLNAGQVCYAIKRIYVPRSMVDKACEVLVALAKKSKVGDGFDPETTVGPIQNKAQFEKLLGYLDDAQRDGKVLTGGKPLSRAGYFIPVTVVRDLPNSSRLVQEEQFGPILPVVAYDSLDEAIEMANSTEFGLGGSVWTSNPERGMSVAARMEAGEVWVNQHFSVAFDVAFTGAKQSGYGLQLGVEGLEDVTQTRVVSVSMVPSYPELPA
jgi:acyl-CoA reductase-like NAD-dependent aldehyde dehydrogenase